MFKTRCAKCDKKVDKGFDFCPYCGVPMKSKEEYGLLGKSDDVSELNSLFPQNQNSFLDKIVGSAFKMIEREIQKTTNNMNKEMQKMPPKMLNPNFELFVNGKRINLPGDIAGVQIEQMPGTRLPAQEKHTKMPKISEELLKKAAKLPRKETKSRLIRTSDKVVYELDTPGLDSLNNVLINKLEDAIEVKAYTDKVVFFKTLNIKLPLVRYLLKEDKLVLEFDTQS